MFSRFRPAPEIDAVYVVLVNELSSAWVPTAIMGVTFTGVTAFIAASLDSSTLLAAAVAGAAVSIAKIELMKRHRSALDWGAWDRPRAARWQLGYAISTIGFAALVGLVTALTFLSSEAALQMLATGLLFGYCSGVAARLSFRPLIAITALSAAAVPASLAAASQGDSTRVVLASVFVVFLLGAFETVRHLYRASSHQIVMRLDMATLARNDSLTGLLNRLGLREAFRELTVIRRTGMVAVHCFDLDGFKPVNDLYGHAVGDMLLVSLADRLRTLKSGGIAARIGGDEFVVVQSPIDSSDEADAFAQALYRTITAPFTLDGRTIAIGVSLGHVTSSSEMPELDRLMTAADIASYQVKAIGGGVAAVRQDPAVYIGSADGRQAGCLKTGS